MGNQQTPFSILTFLRLERPIFAQNFMNKHMHSGFLLF